MNWCLVQSDDRDKEELGVQSKLMEKNRATCEQDPNCSNVEIPLQNVPPYWRKVHATRSCLDNPGCDACLYVDSDAVLNHHHWQGATDVETLLGQGDFGFTPDWARDRMNAGVFAVRNSSTGKAIMDAWLSEQSNAWSTDSEGEWSCSVNGKKCPWAGSEFEQGAFITKVQPQFKDVLHESSPFLWNNDILNCTGHVKHFMGNYGNMFAKDGKQKAIQRYLDSCS